MFRAALHRLLFVDEYRPFSHIHAMKNPGQPLKDSQDIQNPRDLSLACELIHKSAKHGPSS